MSQQPTDHLSDASHIGFEILVGTRRVRCGVSDEALEVAACLRPPSTLLARRQSFDRFRTLIHKAAELKFSALSGQIDDVVMLRSDDLRRVPPKKGFPMFGTAMR